MERESAMTTMTASHPLTTSKTKLATPKAARAIALYLPQFHPIPENNQWWGPGFTEWTNTAKAKPLFRGHHQPNIPADLGFYDLRLPEARNAQAELAKSYSVEAFCYWHYWFAGRRILERPFEEVLQSGQPDHKFCLGWANQTWAGKWYGAHNQTLIEQTYPGEEDDRAHFNSLLAAFRDPRYFRVHGKPLFYIFRPEELPDPLAFSARWRRMAQAAGLEGIYLVGEISDLWGKSKETRLPEDYGFDAGVYIRLPLNVTFLDKLIMRFRRKFLQWPEVHEYADKPFDRPEAYRRTNVFTTVYPNWDNTPRNHKQGLVLQGASPEKFQVHVRNAIQSLSVNEPEEKLLFIKSWNEWAEGNYLEPDQVHGHGFLKVLHQECNSV